MNDWTDENCYSIDNLPAVWSVLLDGDKVIFDNEKRHEVSSQITLNGLSGALSVIFASRDMTSPYVIHRTADIKCFVVNGLNNAIDLEIQNARFISDAPLGNDAYLLQIVNGVQKVKLKQCDFSGLILHSTSISGNGQLLFFEHDGGSPETIFEDCDFSKISALVANCPVVHIKNGKAKSIGTLNVSNASFITNTNSAGRGFFYHESSETGDYEHFEISGYSASGLGAGSFRPFFLQSLAAGKITIGNITGSIISISCGAAETGALVFGQGDGKINGCKVDNLHFVNTGNHEGGVLVVFNGQWVANRMEVRNSSGAFGMVFATSFNGSVIADRCNGYDLYPGAAEGGAFEIDHGIAFYAGGSGDVHLRRCKARRNKVTENGADFFLLHNIAGARMQRDAVVNLDDCEFQSNGPPVLLFNRSENGGNGKTVEVNVTDSIIDDNKDGGIKVSDAAQAGTDSIIQLTIIGSSVRNVDTADQDVGTTLEIASRNAYMSRFKR